MCEGTKHYPSALRVTSSGCKNITLLK